MIASDTQWMPLLISSDPDVLLCMVRPYNWRERPTAKSQISIISCTSPYPSCRLLPISYETSCPTALCRCAVKLHLSGVQFHHVWVRARCARLQVLPVLWQPRLRNLPLSVVLTVAISCRLRAKRDNVSPRFSGICCRCLPVIVLLNVYVGKKIHNLVDLLRQR